MNFHCRRSMRWLTLVLAALMCAPFFAPSFAQEVDSDTTLVADGSDALKPLAVVAFAPYKDLISDINFLGTLSGQPQLGQMVEGGLAFFTQGKGPQALDKTKPWGVIVQTDGQGFLPMFCVPVTNIDDLLGVATAYGAQLRDGDNGIKVLTLQDDKTVYVKHADGWAFVSQTSASLADLPEDPAARFSKLLTEYDVAVTVSVKNVPEAYRQLGIQAMQAGMQQQLEQQQGDATEEELEQRRQQAEAQMEQMVQMINEIDSFTLGWSVDAEQQRTFLDFSYLVQPDSKLSQQLAAYEDTRTNFAGFYQPDAAATATIAMKSDPKLIEENIDQFNAGMQQMRTQLNQAIDDSEDIEDDEMKETLKTAASDWFDALEATMRAGRFDAGATVQLGADSLTIIAGAHVKDPAKIEAGLRKMQEAAKKKNPDAPGIEWNAAEHAGVTFHTSTIPVPEDKDAPRKLLGEELDVAIGIGKEAVYLAAGRDNLEAVKKAIDASAAEPEKEVPPFEVALSLAPIMEAAAVHTDGDEKQIFEKVADMLKNEAEGRDHIRMVGSLIPNGLRYRIEAEEGVLRGIGKASMERQRQALEAAQQGQ